MCVVLGLLTPTPIPMWCDESIPDLFRYLEVVIDVRKRLKGANTGDIQE